MILCAISCGGLFPRSRRTNRSTVPRFTVAPPAATVPFSTLLTNSAASEPELTVAMSHGPLMPWPAMVSATWPWLLTTSRQPAFAVADIPFVVGRLPTTTQPPGRMPRAVVRPTPPGHGPGRLDFLMCAKTVCCPPGETCTIVVPVPCRFLELLKLLTRTLPLTRRPVLRGTTATPYGLTSPLCGTVEAIVLILLNWPMKDDCVPAPAAGAIANAATAAAPNATVEVRMMRWMEDMSQCPFPVVPNWLTLRGGIRGGLLRHRRPGAQ